VPPEPIYRDTLRALLVAAATPIGLWLGWQLQEPSSRLRLAIAGYVDRARELQHEAREAWIRRSVDGLIDAATTATAAAATEPSETKEL
jgi:hypothetical protein